MSCTVIIAVYCGNSLQCRQKCEFILVVLNQLEFLTKTRSKEYSSTEADLITRF